MTDNNPGAMEPCPFCGGDDLDVSTDRFGEYSYVVCSDCSAQGPEKIGAAYTIESWNERASRTDGWQDIASAPKDELLPIALWNGVEVTTGARWESGWADWLHSWMDPQPTHWMPLPTPPGEQG